MKTVERVDVLNIAPDDVVILRTDETGEIDDVTFELMSQKLGARLLIVLPEGTELSSIPRVTLLKELGCCGDCGCVTSA